MLENGTLGLSAEDLNDEPHQVDHRLQGRAHLMTHSRLEVLRMLLLLVQLSLLDPQQLAANLSCHIRDIDGDRGLADVIKRPDLDSGEKGLYLAVKLVFLVRIYAATLPSLPS